MQTSYWFTSPISDVGPSVFSFVTLLVISSLLFAPGTVLHRADIRCLFTELNANQAATGTLLLLFISQSTKPAEHRNCCVCFLTPSIPWPHHENVLLILEPPEQPRAQSLLASIPSNFSRPWNKHPSPSPHPAPAPSTPHWPASLFLAWRFPPCPLVDGALALPGPLPGCSGLPF